MCVCVLWFSGWIHNPVLATREICRAQSMINSREKPGEVEVCGSSRWPPSAPHSLQLYGRPSGDFTSNVRFPSCTLQLCPSQSS